MGRMIYRQTGGKTGGSTRERERDGGRLSTRASVRSGKGLSSATVRPQGLPSTALILVFAALASGCAEKAARLTGNERLLRGGLGTTIAGDTLVDRDTYVTPASTRIDGPTLLVGRSGAFEARSLFRATSWSLPAEGRQIDSVMFRIDFDARVDEDLPLANIPFSLYKVATPWQASQVEWPGPAPDSLLGTGPDAGAPFTVLLDPSELGRLRAWAAQPSDTTGFVLTLDSDTGVRGYLSGTARFEVVSRASPTDTARATRTVHTSQLATDVTIHAPAAPATGSESTLRLGGLFQHEVLLRAPIDLPPAGASINGARFVALVQAPTAPGDSVDLQVFRIRRPWTEGVAVDSLLGLDASPFATLANRRFAAGDSISITVPIPIALEWARDSTTNHGILLRITDSFYDRPLELGSRESAFPPVLRLNTTTPPPPRF